MIMAQFVRFAGVGVIATAIHYVVLIALVQLLSVEPIRASAIAFVIAAVCNYLLNYHFTFASGAKHKIAVARFALVAGAGLFLNTLTMFYLIRLLATPYLVAQITATVLVLSWNFFANRKWTF